MARTKTKPQQTKGEPGSPFLDPKKIHELFGLVGPYDPPAPPIATKGYVTFWDPGLSIQRIREKFRHLFYPTEFIEKNAVTKTTDSWRWRLMRTEPIETGLPYEEQFKKLSK